LLSAVGFAATTIDLLDLSVLNIHPVSSDLSLEVNDPHGSGCFLPLVAMMKATDSG
jgi:hypothetical protein